MDKVQKWGIIGGGKICEDFTACLKHLENDNKCKVMSVATRDISRSKDFADKFSIPNHYDSYEKVLNKDIDIVYIGLIHPQHYKLLDLCIEKRINVICEKPITMNSHELQDIIKKLNKIDAKERPFVMEAMWTRFFPVWQKLIDAVKSGDIGKIRTIQSPFQVKFPPSAKRIFEKELGGGTLLDIGVYNVAIIHMLAKLARECADCKKDSENLLPKELKAIGSFENYDVDIAISSVIKQDIGSYDLLATMQCHGLANAPEEVIICGDKGFIKIPPFAHCPTNIQIHKEVKLENDVRDKFEYDVSNLSIPLENVMLNGQKYTMNFPNSEGFIQEIEEVHDCLKNNKCESSKYTLGDSYSVQRNMDNIRQQIGMNYSMDFSYLND